MSDSRPDAPRVFKAVIPAAGRGRRMRPLSIVVPKEMLPFGNKPMIQIAVEEAFAAGMQEICIVIRKGKETIRDYLLGKAREFAGRSFHSCKLIFVYQKRLNGLGGALSAARSFVGRDPFLMIIPDQILLSDRVSASQQLLSYYHQWKGPVVFSSMVKIPKKEVRYFPGAKGFVASPKGAGKNRFFAISGVEPAERVPITAGQSSEIRGFGRTVFPPAIFGYLTQRFANPNTREVDLWNTFKEFPKKIPHYGCLLKGRACDLGTLAGYLHYLQRFLKTSEV